MQDYVSSNKIKENKYKILRMSLLLGTGVDREDTLNNFEDASREIDAMNDEIYLKNIEDKFYDTLKLEEEEKKLTVLVDYIGGRVEQRISLLSDFANVTGYDLQNLPPIKYYDKLDDYKDRLRYIREYLSNIEQINSLNEEIEKDDKKLNEAYLNRAASEEYNKKIENTLFDKFVTIFKTLEFFDGVNEENIDIKLSDALKQVEESKKSLDIFTKSFTTLSGAGISTEEEKEYLSYVENAQAAYYDYKEQEYILRIYKLLLSKYSDYNQIMYKREEIDSILSERVSLRRELNILGNDIFNSIYDLLERQYDDIKRQSGDIDNIDKLTSKINGKKEELNRLELENQKVEILSLLREFCIIDTYEDIAPSTSYDEKVDNVDVKAEIDAIINGTDNSEVNDSDTNDFVFDTSDFKLDNFDEKEEVNEIDVGDIDVNDEVDVVEKAEDNQVILVEDANIIDLDLIHSKANKVMKRVGEMLGIKTEETKIVSVSNEEEKVVEDNVQNEIEVNNEVENPLFSNNLESDDLKSNDNSEMIENPLFSGEATISTDSSNNDMFAFPETVSDDNNSDFWFPSDTPDALNELPDLDISNNNSFFANNNVADLEFPDLNFNFGSNDMEENN